MNKIVYRVIVAGGLGILPGLATVGHGMDEQHNEMKRGPAPSEITRAKGQGPVRTINIGQGPGIMHEGGSLARMAMPEGGRTYARDSDSDEKKVFENMLCEANTGDNRAMDILSYKYEKGQGVEKDLYLAKMWYEKALADGNQAPRKAYTRLCNQIADLEGRNDSHHAYGHEPFHLSGPTLADLHAENRTPSIPDFQDSRIVVFKVKNEDSLSEVLSIQELQEAEKNQPEDVNKYSSLVYDEVADMCFFTLTSNSEKPIQNNPK